MLSGFFSKNRKRGEVRVESGEKNPNPQLPIHDSIGEPDQSITPDRKFGSPLRVLGLTIAIFITSQLVAAALIEIGLMILSPGSQATSFNQSVLAQSLYVLVAEALAVGGVLLVLRRGGLSLAAIGWGRRPKLNDLTWAIVGFFVFYGLLIVVTALLSGLVSGFNVNQPQDVGFKNLVTPIDQLLALISLVILPPLAEETLVRGYLYSGLRSRWRFAPALILTSLLFGAAHLATGDNGALWAAGADTFVLSVVLVWLREKTGALYAPVIVHVLNNLTAFAVYLHK